MLDAIQTTDGISALRMLLQLLTLVFAAFAGGIALGRFWYSRALAFKQAELDSQQARFATQSERIQFFNDQITHQKQSIEAASDLEEAKEAVKEIKPIQSAFYTNIDKSITEIAHNYFRKILEKIKLDRNYSDQELADKIGISIGTLRAFFLGYPVNDGAANKIEAYLSSQNEP